MSTNSNGKMEVQIIEGNEAEIDAEQSQNGVDIDGAGTEYENILGSSSAKIALDADYRFESKIVKEEPDLNDELIRVPPSPKQIKFHDGEIFYCCDQCDVEFTRIESLDIHKRIHILSNLEPYVCTQCGWSFALKSALDLHKRSHTNKNTKPYTCDNCGQKFTHVHNLNKHTPCEKNWYGCDQCDYKSSRRQSVARHKLKHTNERPHVCDHCGQKFKIKSYLDCHITRVHTGMFVCNVCGQRFLRKLGLQQHELEHTADKLQDCDECGEKFQQKYDLHIHKQSHAMGNGAKVEMQNSLRTVPIELNRAEVLVEDFSNTSDVDGDASEGELICFD